MGARARSEKIRSKHGPVDVHGSMTMRESLRVASQRRLQDSVGLTKRGVGVVG